MKIKRLEISGFKSFCDPTVLNFEQDVTCIVGPNGCGKSNVVDAIRWVMGEQSAKHLRGRAMEDVIFNGSESRGPHSIAEVSLTFDNTDGLGPPEYAPYAEISVTRRLDRQGNSEYLINKTPVRLLDLTNLFLGTGVGRKAYSIIEQGRIGLVVSAKPEDRRSLIEEAAGITKFKATKRAAERKMDQTRQNLLRVSDIIGEIDKTLASLKRQAQKAERYKLYRNEIRDLELWIASHKWLELTAQHRVISEQLLTASASAEGARAALRLREAEIEVERVEVHHVEQRTEQAQSRAYELDNAVRLLESQAQHHVAQLKNAQEREAAAEREMGELSLTRGQLAEEASTIQLRLTGLEEIERNEADTLERETLELDRRRHSAADAEMALQMGRERVRDAETRIARAEAVLAGYEKRRGEGRVRLERLRGEQASLDQRVADLEQEAAELLARLEGLRSGKEQLTTQRGDLEQELNNLRQQIRDSDQRLEVLRAEHASKRSRLHSLEEIQQRFEGVGAGVRALMTRRRGESDVSPLGLVADRFDCAPENTRALAAALGDKLQYVLVEDLTVGIDAISYLAAEKRGRATLMPRVPRTAGRIASIPEGASGCVGRLRDLVQVVEADATLADHLLGDILVVEDIAAARALFDAGCGATLVTRQGEVLGADGRLSGGEGEDAGEHLIEVKREIRELHRQVSALSTDLDAAVALHNDLRKSIAERQAALEAARTGAHDLELALVKADRDVKRAQDAAGESRKRIAAIETEVSEIQRALDVANDEEAAATADRDDAQETRGVANDALAAADEVYRTRRAAVEAQAAVVTEVKVRAAQAKQQAEGDRAALERLRRSVEELDGRAQRLENDVRQLAQTQGDLLGQLTLTRDALQERAAEAAQAQLSLAECRAEYDAARLRLGEYEGVMREVRSRIEHTVSTASTLTVQERELSLAVEHLLESVQERHRLDVRRVLTDFHARELPDAATHERVEELLRLVERMGEINLTAIDEYEERSKRHEYLTAQRSDLETALTQLDKAIRQMNRESRRLFRETFDTVNARFQQMFPRMFGGGRAELKLTNPEDLLESGIEIIAQPPGKKLGSLELMSGGEKALTAVSLIFAIFQFKPSPFCLLDEVDAPLDEANIARFCEMIREMTSQSQFILITHSKRTMELGDVLYGVTMETPGISKLVSVELRNRPERAPTQGEREVAVA